MFRNAKLITVFAMVGSVTALGGCTAAGPDGEQQEIIENLIEAGYPAEDIEIFDNLVYVQKDAHVTLKASREMLETTGTAEQYRTTNLVGGNVSLICVVPTSQFAARPHLSQGLVDAVAAYNALGLSITFQIGTAGGNCDALITAQPMSGVGGSAGFPSGGLPYDKINIGTGLVSYSAGVNAHVVMHELGHTIGFRHSDYYKRSISCGRKPANEGSAGVGAILIPGTPAEATLGGSVMNSCFRASETGDWTDTDIIALNVLY